MARFPRTVAAPAGPERRGRPRRPRRWRLEWLRLVTEARTQPGAADVPPMAQMLHDTARGRVIVPSGNALFGYDGMEQRVILQRASIQAALAGLRTAFILHLAEGWAAPVPQNGEPRVRPSLHAERVSVLTASVSGPALPRWCAAVQVDPKPPEGYTPHVWEAGMTDDPANLEQLGVPTAQDLLTQVAVNRYLSQGGVLKPGFLARVKPLARDEVEAFVETINQKRTESK